MSTVAVLDYGSSNLRSVAKAVEFVAGDHHRIIVSDRAEQINGADRVIFPGQGAIGQCMNSLREKGLDSVIRDCLRNKPVSISACNHCSTTGMKTAARRAWA